MVGSQISVKGEIVLKLNYKLCHENMPGSGDIDKVSSWLYHHRSSPNTPMNRGLE
jgi:hypothetical protein